ncbi:MAG: lipopolysaccharide biosynthesis protein, partial [Rhizobiales bacterium]|nr:lipopolysaccharide biosynthesis protein [Hyphomicrobiales bacterium]
MAKRVRAESEPAPRRQGGELDVGGLWLALRRRKASIIGPTLLLTAAAVAFVTLSTPRYAGETRVLLESRANYLNRPDAERDASGQNAFDPEGVLSQVQVVTSNDIAREAIRKLNLVGNAEFDPSAGSLNPVGRVMALLGLSRDLTDRSVEDRVMQAYYERLSVFPVGKSRVVGIEFSSKDPELAARGANLIADLYLDAATAAKKDLARTAGSWLSDNIDGLRKRVRDAEAKVEEFRSRNGLFSSGRDTTLSQQELAEAATQLSQAKSQQADAQAKAQLIRDMIRSGRAFEISEVSNNELIRRLIEQRVTLRAQLALESRTLGAAHPRIKELNAQIADVETQIRAAAERTVRGMENDAVVAGARVAQLQTALDEQKKRSASGLENDVQLRALEREAKTLRDQLESYLVKYREAVARDTDGAQPADARIISRAVVPSRPAFPKKLPIVTLTALASLILFSALAIARELMGGDPRRVVDEADEADEREAAVREPVRARAESPAPAVDVAPVLTVEPVEPVAAAPSRDEAVAEDSGVAEPRAAEPAHAARTVAEQGVSPARA